MMKRVFTRFLAAVALLTCIALPASGWGQTTVTWPGTTALPGTATAVANDQNITIKTSSTNNYTNPIRIYANTTVTINALNDAKILSVNYEASSTGNYVTYAQNATVTPEVTPTVSGKNVTWTYDESDNITEFTFKPSAQTRSNGITITYIITGATPTCATPTFSPAAGTYIQAQNVSISCATEDATIYYTTNGDDPTTNSTVYTEAISVSSEMTIKAMAAKSGYENSAIATAEYAFITLNHAGTLADPYTVADAHTAIDAGTGTQGVYATGIVSAIPNAWSTQYSNITFNLVDNQGDTDFLQAFRCVSSTGVDASTVAVGDVAVVYGNLTKYGDTYEFGTGCQVVSLEHSAVTVPSITAENVSLEDTETSGEIAYTINNPVDGGTLAASTEADWITNLEDSPSPVAGSGTVTFTCTANAETTARTATVTLTYTYGDNQTVTKDVTVTQAAHQDPHVTWDLSIASYEEVTDPNLVTWSSNYATMTNATGSGSTSASNYLGGDENNRTSTRFYKNNVWTLTPAAGYAITSVVLTATSEGYANAFAGSSWTNATASTSGTTVTVTPENGASAIQAVVGNTCGFTAVSVYYVEDNTPRITLTSYDGQTDPYNLNFPYDNFGGNFAYVIYENFDGTPSFSIQFCNQDGESTDVIPDWLTVEVEVNIDNVNVLEVATIDNYGEARTAYFKVGAANGTVMVYSNLVTVNQAAAPQPSITLNDYTINVAAAGEEAILTVQYENIDEIIADIELYDADGNVVQATYYDDWFTASIDDDNNVSYLVLENDGAARTAYFKVYAMVGESFVYSDLVTVTQAAPVVDYATLPFEWEGGERSAFEALNGTSTYSVGDYGENQGAYRMKLDADGDYIQVKCDQQPGVVTIGVKMVGGGTSSTITVQGSADGETFTNIQALTISGDQNDILTLQTSNAFAATDRYVRLLFTKGSNVGVGPISIAKVSTEPAITLVNTSSDPEANPYLLELSYEAQGGNASGVAVENFEVTDASSFSIYFCDENGDAITAQPNWITVEVVAAYDWFHWAPYVLTYVVEANEGEARTAYFKVRAYNDNDAVYSDLITVNQAAAPAPAIILVNTDSDPEANPYVLELDNGSHGVNAAGVAVEGFEVAGASAFSIYFCDANGDAISAQPDWITVEVDEAYSWFHWAPYVLYYSVQANEGEARTAYFKIRAYNDNDAVYSDLITVTQAAYVIDYATLPFEWEGGERSGFEALNGTSTYSVGDYGENQGVYRMKLDANDDYIQVKCDQQPGVVSIGVKMVGGASTSTITVQGSADGETFTDIEELTISGSQNDILTLETSNAFAATDRYVRLLFTKGSNVGVGPISIAKVSTDPYINLVAYNPSYTNPYLVELPVGPTPESEVTWYHATVEYGNFQVTDLSDFQFQFYDEQGSPIDQPDWIMSCEVIEAFTWMTYDITNMLYVSAHANTGSERSTYFKVYAYATASDAVYSELVTVTQAAAPQQYDLTVEPFENLELITFVNDEIMMEQDGTISVTEGAQVMLSIVGDEGYVIETLMVNGVDHAADIEEDFTYTFEMPAENVAITATAVEAPAVTTYTLATSIESGRHYIITNGNDRAMGAQSVTTSGGQGNNRTAVEITTVGNVAQVASDEVVEFVINGPDGNGFYTIYDAAFPGYLYAAGGTSSNHLKTETFCDNKGQWTISFDAEFHVATIVANISANNARNTMRYNDNNNIFSCYNGGQQDVYLYLKDEETPQYDFYKDIAGYSTDDDNYYLIASPIDDADPVAAGMITDELGAQATPETSTYDFYWFDQTQNAEWQNYRQGTFKLTSGMGYLYANKTNRTIHFNGTPSDNATVSLVKDDESVFAGWNLVGNPLGKVAYIDRDFYVMKADGTEIVTAQRDYNYINPMEGVFVIAEYNDEELTFSSEPLLSKNAKISMNLGNGRGNVIDRAIVRFEEGGLLPKFMLNPGNTKLYIPQGSKDYAVVRSANEGEMPVNFKAAENGTYTLNVEANVEMNYLHLIDNRAGADVDLLANPNYTFEANKGDNANRFKLVFKAGAGIGEYNATETFAYFNGSAWVISNTGDATLQVIDMMGRVLRSEQINGNTAVNINETAGIYMLRLVNGENVMVQKVVVK